MSIATEAARRRTFAIISHPDAGKTTITEKLLLYSGAIHLAGSVRARKASRHAVSDWMEMEKERGISISSSVLQFEYKGAALNLLDTPGHADFSEDTYRTLAAVDSALMLVDHSKGVESRTLKLFEVCRMRKLPIITFMNKMDRDGLDPLVLLDEVSSTLNLKVAPMCWPVGMGRDFKGVVLLPSRELLLYSGGKHGTVKLTTESMPFAEAVDILGAELHEEVAEELDLVEEAGDPWDKEAFLAGTLSPIFWGSAMTNFGVEPLLAFLAEHAATPRGRVALDKNDVEVELSPENKEFTGFIFKIQANMNPRHRDRLAFIRVVSGQFQRGMETRIGRSGEKIRLAKPHSFMAQERSIVDEAWPGDIVGLYDPGKLRIGDTISSDRVLRFNGIPRFAPEHFARLVLADPGKRKQLDAGLTQLAHEGVIQIFTRPGVGLQEPWLGAVGLLQFEVFKERLKNEYRVQVKIEGLPYKVARWVGGGKEAEKWLESRRDFKIVLDRHQRPVMLAESKWALNYALSNAPDIAFYDVEPL
jgi:peptide chain release factor 3